MKKALIYASVASMIDQFNRDNITLLLELGYKVEVAANFKKGNTISQERIEILKKDLSEKNVVWHHIPVPRSLTPMSDLVETYKQSKKLMDEQQYDLIHFHSPIGAAIGRLAARKSRKKGTKLYYTAHGFHFYKGASVINWLTYYPVEYLLSNITDYLITINREDYQRAKSFKTKKIVYIPGVGMNTEKLTDTEVDSQKLRSDLGLSPEELLILSVGELNKNKNHRMILSALASIKEPFKYIICGQGIELENLQLQVKELNLADKVLFLGYREDVFQILKSADIYCFPSIREGLSVSLMEAMAAGLPCIVSQIRGNNDLIDEKGGYLFEIDKPAELETALQQLVGSKEERKNKGLYNQGKIKNFDITLVNEKIKQIYAESLEEEK